MFWHKREDKSFVAVAMSFIVAGAGIFAFGAIAWLANVSAEKTLFALPSLKVIGGLIIMALGYIQLELGLLRKR